MKLLPLLAFASCVLAQEPFRFTGAPCVAPPALHCPDKDCPSDRVINPGPVVEMKTRRTYFLDYPCDLKAGEKVTFILSLHGAGSYGNWQRNYFPLLDYKDKYRLVIATPNSPTRFWTDVDDQYLQNIVEFVVGQLGKENVKAFWLVAIRRAVSLRTASFAPTSSRTKSMAGSASPAAASAAIPVARRPSRPRRLQVRPRPRRHRARSRRSRRCCASCPPTT